MNLLKSLLGSCLVGCAYKTSISLLWKLWNQPFWDQFELITTVAMAWIPGTAVARVYEPFLTCNSYPVEDPVSAQLDLSNSAANPVFLLVRSTALVPKLLLF